jgi:hypothetical protein
MTDARGARAHPGAQRNGVPPDRHPVASYFRTNPQVLVLLIICIVLGLGTFIAVLISLATAGSDQTTGEPSGAILGAHAILTAARWLPL